jgi:hypothetical protein
MIEGQFIRTDADTFAAAPHTARIERLRDHFSPEEVAMFGIGQPYGERYEEAPEEANPLLSGIAASFATTLLFTGVGLLSLPPGALA